MLNKYELFFKELQLSFSLAIKKEYEQMLARMEVKPTPKSIGREILCLGLDIGPQYSTRGAVNFHEVVSAFQRYFRPSSVTGVADIETCAILYALADTAIRAKHSKVVPK